MNQYAHIFAYVEPGALLFRWLALMMHPLKLEASSRRGQRGCHDRDGDDMGRQQPSATPRGLR